MNEIEEILRKQKVTPAPEGLDRRMSGLFSERPASQPGLLLRDVRLWQALSACLVMGGLGFWLGGGGLDRSPEVLPPEKVTTFYIIEPNSNSLRNAFDIPGPVEPFFQPPFPPVSKVVVTPAQSSPTTDHSI